jgi:Zn-dependent protease with chaperone function
MVYAWSLNACGAAPAFSIARAPSFNGAFPSIQSMFTEFPDTKTENSEGTFRLMRPDVPPMHVPAPPIAVVEEIPEQKSALSADELCSAFKVGAIPRMPPTTAYRIGLFAVAAFMLLLPVTYVAFTGFGAWWVYDYSAHTLPRLMRVMSGLHGVAFALAPTVAGSLIVLFMLKPLIAPRGRRMHPIKLLPQAEPKLHEFIGKLCKLVGAPRPAKIEVDCNVNAAASLHGGLRGFISGKMTLTVGLPLVAGLNLNEFTGVLAHEFGHFAQGGAMRVTYIIRRVNAWFYRVVYERDSLDEWLVGSMFTGVSALSFLGVVANIGVWFSRLILKSLMYLGHAVSSYLLRQMEYAADACAARVVGSEVSEATTKRIAVLAGVADDLRNDVLAQWRETLQLPDDFPALFAHRLAHLKSTQIERWEAEDLAEKPSWADSHPTPAQRIAAVQRAAERGVFAVPGPALRIFDNFVPLSQAVSLAHYEDDLDLTVNLNRLDPVSALIGGER